MGRFLATPVLLAGALYGGWPGLGVAAGVVVAVYVIYRAGYSAGSENTVEVLAGLAPPDDEQVAAFLATQRKAADEGTQ